ncbi:MAG: ScyD/ScyE family protein [bacterium]|nr:ScyD/ScyE family protein [bacterium]
MRTKFLLLTFLALLTITVFPNMAQEPSYTVLLDGLNSPRGVNFSPDGVLYVVEAGNGGATSIPGPFDGPVQFGFSARVSAVVNNERVTLIDYLPSAQVESAPGAPIEVLGAMDVAILQDELWVITGHQLPGVTLTGLAIGYDTVQLRPFQVLDLYGYESENDVDGTGEFLSNPGSIAFMPNSKTALIVDSGANAVYRKAEDGAFTVLHTWDNNPVPTGVDFSDDGTIYALGFLSGYPFVTGAGRVDVYNADTDDLLVSYEGLTTVTDVIIEADGTILAVQYASFDIDRGGWQPNSGSVIAITPDGTITPVLSNLNFPYAIAKHPIDDLYAVSVNAVGELGTGQVITFSLLPPTEG